MSKDANYIELIQNDEWQVLTSEGFKDFKGLGISKNSETLDISFDNGMSISVTPEHEFINGNKIFAKDVTIGMKIKSVDGYLTVVSIQTNKTDKKMYDLLHVEDTHHYLTNDISSGNCLFIDECSFIQDHIWEDFYNSVYPTISSGKTSKIIMVSTPKGMNHFFNIYNDAARGKSTFAAIKIPWWERPDRDQNWKDEQLKNMTQIQFNQEFGCAAGSEMVDIKEDNWHYHITLENLFNNIGED